MATIVTRAGKGSPLTHNEVDANFESLNSDKVETSSVSAFGATLIDDADAATARTTLGLGSNDSPTFTNTQLAAIAASKAVTAVDVFVYDTSRDSDGGAWRKRTQHTSWYNETLNTATRGSRREFPAVAVIVAESNKVTIYDGDDPALPMWMIPASTVTGYAAEIQITCVSALNGIISIGCGGSGFDLSTVDFIKDSAFEYGSGFYRRYNDNIATRSSSLRTAINTNTLVDRKINDVAMTVLPDAPIDPATGLPVPTIAVATAGGVSVIKDDGTVVDLTHTIFGNNNSKFVSFIGEGIIWSSRSNVYAQRLLQIPNADYSSAPDFYYCQSDLPRGNANEILVLDGDFVEYSGSAIGQSDGVTMLDERPSAATEGMVAYTTSTYNTGWMNGDIKGAFLSDTDDTDLVGSGELVTNGTFDTDTTGWTAARAATLTWVSGAMQITYGGTDYPQAQQTITTVAGKRYKLQVTQTAGVTLVAAVGTVAGGNQLGSVSGTGSLTLDFVATSTTSYLTLQANATGSVSVTVDNVSVKLADADRSVNNKGLIVNGTVTRTPVATGADLVGYTFSTSNYLRGFGHGLGAGDFSVIAWYKPLDTSTQVIANFVNSDLSAESVPLFILSGNLGHSFLGGVGGTSTGMATPAGQWSLLEISRKDGVLNASVNGRRGYSAAYATDFSANLDLLVGVNRILGNPADGSTALLRISATALTAEQIAKIYNDEKFLFQDNAQATLYGASDAVTALAHDPVTDLLHVGTSAGRSVFSGLRRVSNTTTAVGTAISASNGLVVEE